LLRKLLVALAVLLSLLLAFELTFAFGARRLAVSLASLLAGTDVTVGAVRADPLRGLAVLEDVVIPGSDGGMGVYVKEINVKARYSLSEKRFFLDSVALVAPEVYVERGSDGRLRIPGLWSGLPGGTGTGASGGGAGSLGVGLTRLEVKNGVLHYTDRAISRSGVVFTITDFGGAYERAPSGSGTLSFTGMVDGKKKAPVRLEAKLATKGQWTNVEGSGGVVGIDVREAFPFLQDAFPVRLTGGSMTWAVNFNCTDGYLRSRHIVSMEGLTVETPAAGIFLPGARALKAGELADYIQSQAGKLSFDFTIDGPLNALRQDRSDLMNQVISYAIARRIETGTGVIGDTLRTIGEGVSDVLGVPR